MASPHVVSESIDVLEPTGGERELLHPALDGVNGVPLEQSQLTDQQCLGVLLQGATLWAHLEHGGWVLPAVWEGAKVTEKGHLKVSPVQRGRSRELVQVVLLQLLRRLFRTSDNIAGRGEARRIARYLMSRWQQILAPMTADLVVEEILEAAPFLWQNAFAEARVALVAEHVEGDSRRVWIAGPGAPRRRMLDRATDPEAIARLLASPEARDLWDGWQTGLDALELAEEGRWHRAVAVWHREPPRGSAETLAYANCLFSLGRYAQTLEALRRQNGIEARLLRARAQLFLGELGAANGTIRRLSKIRLSGKQLVVLTEVAVRVLGARRQHDEIRDWVARGLSETEGKLHLEARIVAAGAAWDCKDLVAMARHLEASRAAAEEPDLGWRWHQMMGLWSIETKEWLRAVEHVSIALRCDRRRLLRAEAGRLWSELARSRVHADDLPGAERAARHAQRLLRVCEGPSPTTLALYNLAEVRLRRGRLSGVESILEQSIAENRRSGNRRGVILDLELWVRLDLAQGRASAALARCNEALALLDRPEHQVDRPIFEMFAARANGWLGRPQQAAVCLERGGESVFHELEPEERPAVWALADRWGRCSQEALDTRWDRLWKALAIESHPVSEAWDELDSLEPFRAARLVFDLESVMPGVTPPRRLRSAIAALRNCGADALVEKLESRSISYWRALNDYLLKPTKDDVAIVDLFTSCGYSDINLTWVGLGQEETLLPGKGGGERLEAHVEGGKVVLRAMTLDRVLRTLFALVRLDIASFVKAGAPRSRNKNDGGIVGESAGLGRALARLDLLAKDDFPVLLLGESGTGKELMAKRVHKVSARHEGPFLPVNCAEISETLTQSDLFGHVKGSFTGADQNRSGVFESAREGTVFLDEIGDLPLAAQGKLLRVLQEGEIRRVGESFSRKVDVRVITATHRNLERMVDEGGFRQDLFFRLKVATIELPPLRDRGRDILLLADHFLASSRSEAYLSEPARRSLMAHHWPGNVRELRNVLQVAMALSEEGEIRSEHLELPERTGRRLGDYHQLVEQYRRSLVSEALSDTGGNRAAAARQLGLTRQALSYLVKQLGLS